MYLHFNEICSKNFDDENNYGLGQAFNYSLVTVDPTSKKVLNSEEIDLLKKLDILL